MESLTKFMNWEIFRLGEASITVSQVVAVSLTIAVALVMAGWLIRRLSQRLLKGTGMPTRYS